MTTQNSNEKRCFWCNNPGAGDESSGGIVKNGITFCWQSALVPFELCGKIREKIDTMINDYECPICMETKKAMEMPSCSHKVCLDCYKTIYFGVSEVEKPCFYRDLNLPDWTYEQQFDEDGNWIENEKQNKHDTFLEEKMNYEYEIDKRPYEELIRLRDSLMYDRQDWMNNLEVVNYENELFRICSEWIIKEDKYLQSLTKGNESCPMCRAVVNY